MATRAELDVEGQSTAVLEPHVDEAPCVLAISGVEIFISARRSRRLHLPASLREGRHRAKDERKQRGVGKRLVDVDGETETARIALRRRFEEIAAADSGSHSDPMAELRQSVAG